MTTSLMDRVQVTDDGCWLWTGYVDRDGYGRQNEGRLAHRLMYEALVGPIPEGLTIDHLCRVRHCVNPAHLEPVTLRENVLRGYGLGGNQARRTHCPQGHPYDEENTYKAPGSRRRYCRACQRTRAEQKRKVAA